MTQKNKGPEWRGVDDDVVELADYLTEIEAAYSRARGKRSMISPLDWQLARKWETAGVPLHIVVRSIDECSSRYRSANRTGTINTLRYFDQEVQKQFAAWQQSQVGKNVARGAGEALDQPNAADAAIACCEEIILRFAAARKTGASGLRLALKDVEDAVFAIVLQIEGNGDTSNTDDQLSALSATFDQHLIDAVPAETKIRITADLRREFPNAAFSEDVTRRVVLKELYKIHDLPRLTLYEL